MAPPADAELQDKHSFLRRMTNLWVGKADQGGLGEPKQYKKFFEQIDKTEKAQSESTAPQVGGNKLAGTSGDNVRSIQMTSQGQTRNYQKPPSQKYMGSGGMPNGDPFEPGGIDYYDTDDISRSGSYASEPGGHKHLKSPPHVQTYQPQTPQEYSTLQDVVRAAVSKTTNTDGPANSVQQMITTAALQAQADFAAAPHQQSQQAQAAVQGAAQGAADAMADSFNPAWEQMLRLSKTSLLNVANEATGSACKASQPVKTYENAVYLVMEAYKKVYLPAAVLLLLPGAVMTQVKGLVTFGVLCHDDEDAVSPFTGVLRALIAVFLIPASQLIVSYAIDVGNSMQYSVYQHINYSNIFKWADEQVFRAPIENYENTIKAPKSFKVLGKMSQGPEKESGVASQSPATVMLQMLVNSTANGAAFGLVILSAFQIALACYLLLMGPLACAFYAWPSGTGSLFMRVFTNWVDAIVNVSLWRFWWCICLLCIDTRLVWVSDLDMYSEWEMLVFLAFLFILMYVPFNPFEYKAGDMVSQIMQKADQAVGEATSKG